MRAKERRNDACRFKSLQDLLHYYEEFLPVSKLELTVRETAQLFISRSNASADKERLQFIKSCEQALEADRMMYRLVVDKLVARVP